MRSLICFLVVVLTVMLGSQAKPTKRNAYSGHAQNIQEWQAMCAQLCSDSNWCPPSCPESVFHHEWKRTAPYNDRPGNLSFEDYMFLRMLGRVR